MTGSSLRLTMGTILDRAATAGALVTISFLGDPCGISGHVLHRDDSGVAVEIAGGDLAVIRLDQITAVRATAVDLGVTVAPTGEIREEVKAGW